MSAGADSFQSPYDVPVPDGAEGWEQMYNWYHLRGEERREEDEQRFWFQDRLHHPGVLPPYDEIQCECWWQALGAFNTRILAMPPAYGVDQRIINGYVYVTPVPADPDAIAAPRRAVRAPRRPLLRELGRDLRRVEGEGHRPARGDQGDRVRAPARGRGRVRDLRAPRLLDGLRDDRATSSASSW